MTNNPESPKSRTVALPKITKGSLTGHQATSKNHSDAAGADNQWNGFVFSPYLVPLSRRVE